MGQSAAASVIGTALYGQLPSKKKIIEEIADTEEDDIFGFSSSSEPIITEKTENLTKQFLIFSDSRQEAAYFASYFDTTYHNLLRRRVLLEVLKSHSDEYKRGVSVSVLCKHLEVAFEKYRIFPEDRYKEEALKTILDEMINQDMNSLEGLGIISFVYHKTESFNLPVFPPDKTQYVINILADTFRRKAALNYENIADLGADDRAFFQYTVSKAKIALSKECKDERKGIYETWIPERRNKRTDYLLRLSEKNDGVSWSDEKISQFLTLLWNKIFIKNNSLITEDNQGYQMKIDEFKVYSIFSDDIPKYICSKCGKITINNVLGVCMENRCNGILEKFSYDRIKDNHYYNVYNQLDIYDLIVKEHTAQLDLEKAKEYQDLFVGKGINVLSCSTTFEMGVDVGDLETVFMKNMPPTPANYIQRAGRAGRRTDSAAYALTFCKLSSHDLNFYKYPEKMIRGHILPPSFKISNEKIIKRHMNACCFSEFFRKYPLSFSDVETFFYKDYGMFVNYIDSRDSALMEVLRRSVPVEMQCKIEGWLDNLTSDDGDLIKVCEQVQDDIKQLDAAFKEAKDKDLLISANGFLNAARSIKETHILTFLSRKGILPKYGFPVDSVELQVGVSDHRNNSKLRLSRDLSIAISEYAPGSEIIADGMVYTSRYIKLPPKKNHALLSYHYNVCSNPECGCINTSIGNTDTTNNCIICGSDIKESGNFIIPEYGFIADLKSHKATTRKPEKTYRGDVHYIGNSTGETADYKIGDTEIRVTKTTDDELLIMNNTSFAYCPICGYSRSIKGGIRENSYLSEKEHHKPNNQKCTGNKLVKTKIGHKLKTDVVIININKAFEKGQALSVLYAILEGISSYFTIERKDISGCLYVSYEHRILHTTFVLFDTVPGGAGHVGRIAAGGKEALNGILKEAYRIVSECTCGGENGDGACYSCLCNYENQRQHDKLNRGLVIKYIESIYNEC